MTDVRYNLYPTRCGPLALGMICEDFTRANGLCEISANQAVLGISCVFHGHKSSLLYHRCFILPHLMPVDYACYIPHFDIPSATSAV